MGLQVLAAALAVGLLLERWKTRLAGPNPLRGGNMFTP